MSSHHKKIKTVAPPPAEIPGEDESGQMMGMPLPNILKDTLQTSDQDNRRSRIRMELSVPRAEWLMGKILEEIKSLEIGSGDFHQAYTLFNSLKSQIEKLKSDTETPGTESE